MTAPKREALGRRAVACAAWRWLPGMEGRTSGGYYALKIVCLGYSEDQERRGVAASMSEEPRGEPVTYVLDGDILRDCDGGWSDDGDGAYPDLSDPATLGCLLALVREAWGDDLLYASSGYDICGERWWSVNSTERRNDGLRACGLGRSEAEALVAALEAAPVPS